MEILDGLEIIDLCLFHVQTKTLIIPDVHIGYEEYLNKKGILIPRHQYKLIMQNIKKIAKTAVEKYTNINSIVILGDLKHEFSRISETEWRHCLQFLDYLAKLTKNITLLQGNHDTFSNPIMKKRELKMAKALQINDMLLVHGDIVPELDKKTKKIIIGHEHSAITLYHGPRGEKFKCFLKGKFKRKDLILCPSFNPLIEGTDVSKEKFLSPFLKNAKIKDFEAFIIGDKPYYFGKLKHI